MSVAQTILDQLGAGRVSRFIGVTQLLDLGDGLSIRYKAQGLCGNHVEIRLAPDDTYTVKFYNIRKLHSGAVKPLKEFSGIYCDQLVELFERTTGLYLHF